MMKFKMIAAVSVAALALTACATKAPVEEAAASSEAIAVTDDMSGAKSGTVDSGNMGTIARAAAAPNIGDRVYFDLNGDTLDSDDQSILTQHAQRIATDPSARILVAGNCDERGTREYNLALGERRASVVKDYLVSLGIDGSRIDTISYGKERPVAAGSDEQSWALNRNGFIQMASASGM